MGGDEETRSALSSSSSDDGIRFLATGNGNCDSGIPWGRPVRCRVHAGPGPCGFEVSPQDRNSA